MDGTRSSTVALAAIAAAWLVACAGGETNPSASSAGGPGGAGASASTTTGMGGAGGATSASGGAGGAGGNTSSTSSGGAGGIEAELTGSQLYINCQPIVADDPVLGSFTASYTNLGMVPQSATVFSASLSMMNGMQSLSWSFDVSPPTGGPVQPGSTLPVEHTKQPKMGTVEGFPCDFCGGTWELTVSWDMGGGMTATDSLPPAPVACVF